MEIKIFKTAEEIGVEAAKIFTDAVKANPLVFEKVPERHREFCQIALDLIESKANESKRK